MTCSWGTVLSLSAVLLLAGGLTGGMGCAKGGDNAEDGETTSEGGAGGEVGVGGMAGMGGSGGTPAPCAEDPCKLTAPQCGCEADDRCSLLATGQRACVETGTAGPLEACVAGQCGEGMFCVNNGTLGGLGGFCHQFCETDADCNQPTQGPGGICVLPVNGGAAMVCSQNCDPVTDAGCKEYNTGLKCDIARETMGAQRWFTRCVGVGAGLQDDLCTSTNQCTAGHGCTGVTGMPNQNCLRWCTPPMTGLCPGGIGHTCNGFTSPALVGAIEYGACVPP